MQVYWVKFPKFEKPTALNLGAGVTGRDEADARALIRAAFGDVEVAHIGVVDDIRSLEANHVRPNMGDFLRRGVWFPKGHELPNV
jgi:hypothetical protein